MGDQRPTDYPLVEGLYHSAAQAWNRGDPRGLKIVRALLWALVMSPGLWDMVFNGCTGTLKVCEIIAFWGSV